jgi:hypothetical protein
MNTPALQMMVARLVRGQVRAFLRENPEYVDIKFHNRTVSKLAHRISCDIASDHHLKELERIVKEN